MLTIVFVIFWCASDMRGCPSRRYVNIRIARGRDKCAGDGTGPGPGTACGPGAGTVVDTRGGSVADTVAGTGECGMSARGGTGAADTGSISHGEATGIGHGTDRNISGQVRTAPGMCRTTSATDHVSTKVSKSSPMFEAD